MYISLCCPKGRQTYLSVTRCGQEKRCEWTGAEITFPNLVLNPALVTTSFSHNDSVSVRKSIESASRTRWLPLTSTTTRHSKHITTLKQLVTSCIIYDAGSCLFLAGKVLPLTSGQTALTLSTINQVLSASTINRISQWIVSRIWI
jgi:hypothetical protein